MATKATSGTKTSVGARTARAKPAAKKASTTSVTTKVAKTAAPKTAPARVAKPAVKPAAKSGTPAAAKPAVKPVAAQATSQQPKAAAPAVKQATKDKAKKSKLVRDSFTMPEPEYQVLGEVKKACLKAGIEVKKSELLRVGVAMISQMDVAQLKQVLDMLPPLKPGRPKKDKQQ